MNSSEQIYDQAYRDRYVAQGATTLGKAIYYSRWALIERYVKSGTVLDYGSGPGMFNAHGSDSFKRLNYDINPTCGFTEKVWDGNPPYKVPTVDILTMWDSIEHIPNFFGEVTSINAEWVFLSTPNVMSVHEGMDNWKHTRLGEHIHHFEPVGLKVIFEEMGYELLETNYDEGRLRDAKRPDAIFTQVYRKRQ